MVAHEATFNRSCGSRHHASVGSDIILNRLLIARGKIGQDKKAMSYPIAGGGVLVQWNFTDPGDGHGHGLIREYHLPGVRASVIAERTQAFQNGQRRIAVCTEYLEGGTSFHLDSSNGLSTQDKANLKAFCADLKGLGYESLLLETGPAWSAAPENWMNSTVMATIGEQIRPFEPLSYERNFRIVAEQFEVLLTAGFGQVELDSHAEAIHGGPMDPEYLKYLQRWVGDIEDEVGYGYMSLSTTDVGTDASCVDNIRAVYGGNFQPVWYPHIYRGLPGSWAAFKARMDAAGLGGRGYRVSECYSDDPVTALTFNSDPNVFWWNNWPIGTTTPQGAVQDRFPTTYLGTGDTTV